MRKPSYKGGLGRGVERLNLAMMAAKYAPKMLEVLVELAAPMPSDLIPRLEKIGYNQEQLEWIQGRLASGERRALEGVSKSPGIKAKKASL